MKKNTNLLSVGLMLVLTLTGCNRHEAKQDSAKNPGTLFIEELHAKAEAEKIKQEAEKVRQEAEQAKEEAEKDRWRYSTDTDKMTSKVTRFANITSENSFNFAPPYEGDTYGSLMIRQRASDGLSAMFSISRGQFICMQSCRINVRFDDKPAMRFTGIQPADYSSTDVFLSPASKFLAEIKKSKKVLIEATYYSAGSRVSEFKTDGFKWENKAGK